MEIDEFRFGDVIVTPSLLVVGQRIYRMDSICCASIGVLRKKAPSLFYVASLACLVFASTAAIIAEAYGLALFALAAALWLIDHWHADTAKMRFVLLLTTDHGRIAAMSSGDGGRVYRIQEAVCMLTERQRRHIES